MSDDDPSSGFSRRSFARMLGGAGLAGGLGGIDLPGRGGAGGPDAGGPGGGSGGPSDVRFRGDRVEIPSMYRHTNHEAVEDGAPPERETVYTAIPRELWIRNEAAYGAERRINALLRERHGTDLIRAGVRTDSSHVNHERVIDVRVVEQDRGRAVGASGRLAPGVAPEAVREGLPGEVDGRVRARDESGVTASVVDEVRGGFPVEVTQVRHELQTDEVYDHRYRPVPGGAKMQEGGPATICTPAFDWGLGDHVLVTAGHVTGPDAGEPCYQPHSTWWGGNYIGDSDEGHFEEHDTSADTDDDPDNTTFDAATIDEEVGVTYDLASDGGDDQYWSGVAGIAGTVPWAEIKNHEIDHDYELYLQGSTTGRNKDHIHWVSDTYNVFETWVDSEGGDSGGPHFKIEDGYAYIAGVHDYGREFLAGATAMVAVETRFGLTV